MDQTIMTATTSSDLPPLHDHPAYIEGMVFIGSGRWRQAHEAFQLLHEVYPHDREVKDVLKEVQMRATMAEFQPRPRSKGPAYRHVRWLVAAILVMVFIAIAGYLAYELWISPVLIYEFRLGQVTDLRNEADEAMAAGAYARARQALEKLQTILSEDPETLEALRRAERAEKLAALYGEAKALLTTGDWDQAIEVMTELQSLDAQYRDLPQLLQVAQQSQALDKRFQSAEADFERGNWAAAITQYEVLRQDNLAYRFEETQSRLFESHLRYGQSLLGTAGTDPEQIAEALSHFQASLKLKPIDANALGERRLAETYLAALDSVDQDEKIELLQTIYTERPEYAGQTTAQLLYTLLIERADSQLAAGDEQAAAADYQSATQLLVEDPSEAQQKLTKLTVE